MADETRNVGSSSDEVLDQAAQHTLAANPLVGVRGSDILDSARALLGHMITIDDGHLFLVTSADKSAEIISEFLR
jgi:hypothetical protein